MSRRNCLACTRWLHAHEFPYRFAKWCSRCERAIAWADHEDYQREVELAASRERYQQRTLRIAAAKVASGEVVWAEPIRRWLIERVWLPERPGGGQGRYVARWQLYGLDQLAEWAGAKGEKTIRRLRDGETLVVTTEFADGILLRAPAAPAFDSLYPPDELDPALLAAA